MYQFLTKNGQVAAFGLGTLLIIIFLAIALPSAGSYNFETLTNAEMADVKIFDFGLLVAGFLALVAALGMLVFGLYHVASNPKGSMKGIIGFGILVAVFVISYSMSSGEPGNSVLARSVAKFAESGNGVITPANLKFIGGGITTAIVMTALAIGAFIITGIGNLFK